MFVIAVLCCVFVSILANPTLSPLSVSVNTTSGHTVHGVRESVPGFAGTVQVFKGVPYAKPPVGELRLKPPQEPEPETLIATGWQASCQQSQTDLNNLPEEIQGAGLSEDCLYLNVWVPEIPGEARPRDVMVWIHGGGFTGGSGSMFDSRFLATMGKVIVVTLNYRLGVFGFLPTGGAEGTLGLQDQVMALKWVQKNIASFGGDPSRVTIFGQSAGAACVSFLTRSPKAKGLFKRAISQSGEVSSPWAIVRAEDRDERLQQIQEIFRNDFQCYQSVVECTKSVTSDQLIALTTKLVVTPPTVDYDFVTTNWDDVQATHEGLELMMGTTPEESAYGVYRACTWMYTKPCHEDAGLTATAMRNFNMAPSNVDMDNLQNVIHAYNQWFPMYVNDDENANMMAATYMATDTSFHVPTNRTASALYTAGYRVYVYLMDLVPRQSMLPRAPWSDKAQHGDDLPFVFAWRTGEEEQEELQQQEHVVKLWTDFAKGQHPAHWFPFSHQGDYLHINARVPEGYSDDPYLPPERDWFWRQYYNYGIFPQTPVISVDSATKAVVGMTFLIVAAISLFFRWTN